MKFTDGTVGMMVVIMGSFASDPWRPKKLMIFAKEHDSLAAIPKRSNLNIDRPIKKHQIANIRKLLVHEHFESKNTPDVGFLSSSIQPKLYSNKSIRPNERSRPQRQMQSTCTAGFISCTEGYLSEDSATPCSIACNGECCTGVYACYSFTGDVCRDGSCDGDYSCARANIEEITYGCRGMYACAFMGDYGGYVGSVIDSCLGENVCFQTASYSGVIYSMIESCVGVKACSGMGLSSTIGDILKSCTYDLSCRGAADGSKIPGGILQSCNALNACDEFGDEDNIFGAISNCCNTESECLSRPSFPMSCLDQLILSLAIDGCVVNGNTDNAELLCRFNSTKGVTAQAEILIDTCASNNNFASFVSSFTTKDEIISARYYFASSINDDNINAQSFTKNFCLRGDMLVLEENKLVPLASKKFDVVTTLFYSESSGLRATEISLTPFASVIATLGVCGDGDNDNIGDTEVFNMQGSTVTICLSVDNTDAAISLVRNVTIVEPSTLIIDNDGAADDNTVVGELPSSSVSLTMMLLPEFFGGNDHMSVTGMADLDLGEVMIQGYFTVEIPLTYPPSSKPSSIPSSEPSNVPSGEPSSEYSSEPSSEYSSGPSGEESNESSNAPSSIPSNTASRMPTMKLSNNPSNKPSKELSREPSSKPSGEASEEGSIEPSETPSEEPSLKITNNDSNESPQSIEQPDNSAITTEAGSIIFSILLVCMVLKE